MDGRDRSRRDERIASRPAVHFAEALVPCATRGSYGGLAYLFREVPRELLGYKRGLTPSSCEEIDSWGE